MKFSEIKNGAFKLGQSVLQIGIASKNTIRKRRETCKQCEYHDHQTPSHCIICHCFIKHKTRLAKERCPMGYWIEETEE